MNFWSKGPKRVLHKQYMRVLDVTNMRLVHRGADWPTGRGDPSSKGMVGHLVRNEKLVTWLQPTGKHHIRDQIPALRVGDRFCSLSVRMMKAIWRYCCLCQFANGLVNCYIHT